MNILFKNNDFKFLSLHEKENYPHSLDLNIIIDNYELISEYFSEYTYIENSIDSFIDLLFLKKIDFFNKIKMDVTDENIELKLKELMLLTQISDVRNFNKIAIKFINNNYSKIFSSNVHQLEESVIELVFSFQNGIQKSVFEYLISENKYLVFNNYEQVSKVFENNKELLETLFSFDNILEFCEVRLKVIINIYIYLSRKKGFEYISERLVRGIIDYGYSIKDVHEERDLLHVSIEIETIYKFLNSEKHIEANNFKLILETLKKELDIQLMNSGTSISQEIPAGQIVEMLTEKVVYPFTILELTHEKDIRNKKFESRLNLNSKGIESVFDKLGSNHESDEFFTHSHKSMLSYRMSVMSVTLYHLLFNSDDYFDEIFEFYCSMINEVYSKIIGSEQEFTEDIEALFQMLFNLKMNQKNEKIIIQTQSYGMCIFLCSYIEKLLRDFYFFEVKENKYVSMDKITLSNLLDSEKNQEMKLVFGKSHLKHLKYFLLTEGQKKIGYNYRNRLAHWRDIGWDEINPFLVFKLFYLFTDILNTIYVYLILNPKWEEIEW